MRISYHIITQLMFLFYPPSIKRGKTEALGVVLLEAMASGCPVIGSNVGGIPDIIVDGENGFLVPEQRSDILAEKIVQLLSDDKLKEKFRNNGFTRIQQSFTWDHIMNQFWRGYSKALDNDKKS